MTCAARQYAGAWRCEACDLAWDTGDDDPPPCLTPRGVYIRDLPALMRSLAVDDRQRAQGRLHTGAHSTTGVQDITSGPAGVQLAQ